MNIIVNGFRPWFMRYLKVVAKILLFTWAMVLRCFNSMVFVRFRILLMLLSVYTLPVHPLVRPPVRHLPSGPVHPPLWHPPFGPILALSVWPCQPRRRAPSAPSVRPHLLLSTNNYKFFQVFVSQCLYCVRSLKSVASLDVVPLHETHFTRAFGQGSQS
jgi:hypothetical protein